MRSLGIIHHCSVFRLVAAVACPLVISHVPSATFPHQPTSLQGAFPQEYVQLLYLGCGGTLGPQRLSQGYLRRCPGFHFYRTWCPFLAPPSKNGDTSLLLPDPHRLSKFSGVLQHHQLTWGPEVSAHSILARLPLLSRLGPLYGFLLVFWVGLSRFCSRLSMSVSSICNLKVMKLSLSLCTLLGYRSPKAPL